MRIKALVLSGEVIDIPCTPTGKIDGLEANPDLIQVDVGGYLIWAKPEHLTERTYGDIRNLSASRPSQVKNFARSRKVQRKANHGQMSMVLSVRQHR